MKTADLKVTVSVNGETVSGSLQEVIDSGALKFEWVYPDLPIRTNVPVVNRFDYKLDWRDCTNEWIRSKAGTGSHMHGFFDYLDDEDRELLGLGKPHYIQSENLMDCSHSHCDMRPSSINVITKEWHDMRSYQQHWLVPSSDEQEDPLDGAEYKTIDGRKYRLLREKD